MLRVGGAGMLGMTLGQVLRLQAAANDTGIAGGPGWGQAKSVILVYLQGGPSHLDMWDPKPDAPEKVRSVFQPIETKVPGVQFTEILPKLAQVNDKFTMIRSMSYTPNGLFNHTAAIYQMMTGYTTDKVSPSGQLEPPSPADFPNFGSQIVRLQPTSEPMLPFVMLPRPLQESNVVGKGGTAGFLGKGFDPYYLYPTGDDMDMNKMDQIKVDDLKLSPDVFAVRLQRRADLRKMIDSRMEAINKAVENQNLDEYYERALNLIVSGAPARIRSQRGIAADPRPLRAEHVRTELPAGPPSRGSRHARRGSHLAESRQLRQPLLGSSRRADRTDEEPVGTDVGRRLVGPDRGSRSARHAGRNAGRGGRRVWSQSAERGQHFGQRQQRRRT